MVHTWQSVVCDEDSSVLKVAAGLCQVTKGSGRQAVGTSHAFEDSIGLCVLTTPAVIKRLQEALHLVSEATNPVQQMDPSKARRGGGGGYISIMSECYQCQHLQVILLKHCALYMFPSCCRYPNALQICCAAKSNAKLGWTAKAMHYT